ncbi:MAG TPA: hypothetical protein VM389_00890, partial [Phycisphaerae bacterium]|nr:hypothetical protein [Phycisphaerae bacterium]
YTGGGGGLYSGPGGGMYTGSDPPPYMSNIPPWPHFLRELDKSGYQTQAEIIRRHLPDCYWPENFFEK